MKLYKNTLLAVACATMLAFSSCEKNIEIQQISEITSASMWKSQGDFDAAVNGMYVQLRDAFATNQVLWGDLRTGLYEGGKIVDVGHANIMNNTIYRDNAGTDWTALYTTINSANLIIKYATSVLPDGPAKNRVIADAKFVRAYTYFWIARIWGDAPLLTSGFESDKQEDLFPSRNPASEIFQQVEKDILETEAIVTASQNEKFKVSFGAINMLKADYFLWKAKKLNGGTEALNVAENAVNKVMTAGYSLLPSFEQVFSANNKKNSEIIFSINFQRDEFVGGFPSLLLIPNQYLIDKSLIENPVKIGSAQQYICLNDTYNNLVNEQANDTRRFVSVMNVTENNVLHRWINKFPGEFINNTRFFSSNLTVYRLSEAYLMKAEILLAKNDVSGAVTALNVVAKRAYGVDNYYSSSVGSAALKDNIVDEYLKEFVAEGKGWFMFVRNDVAFQRVPGLKGKENATNILFWPITSASINNNPKIKQTDGYN